MAKSPSLMDADPRLPELLTHHASLPVIEGQKLAAVTWIRAYDWRTPRLERGCEANTDSRRREPPLLWLPRYMQAREESGLAWKVPTSLVEKARGATSQAAAAQAEAQPVSP